jgi:hypothetical protein
MQQVRDLSPGANPAFIRSLKYLTGERSDYEEHIAYLKRITWDYFDPTRSAKALDTPILDLEPW